MFGKMSDPVATQAFFEKLVAEDKKLAMYPVCCRPRLPMTHNDLSSNRMRDMSYTMKHRKTKWQKNA